MLALMNYNATFSTLAAMAHDLDAGTAGQTWILGSIALGTAVLLLAVGGIADDRGRKWVFVAGALTLAISSVLCALAPTTAAFVAGRLLQGGATAPAAAGLGLIGHDSPPARNGCGRRGCGARCSGWASRSGRGVRRAGRVRGLGGVVHAAAVASAALAGRP